MDPDPFDQFSETISESLYHAWVEEVKEAKRPHAFIWKYAWMKVWPTIRSEIARQIVEETYRVPKPTAWSGGIFVALATILARPGWHMVVVVLTGILFLVVGVEWKNGSKDRAGPSG